MKARRIGVPRWPLLLLLAGLTLAAYWPIFGAGFIYDDRLFVTENPSIRNWESIPAFFTDPVGTTASIPWPGIWRPMRGISYAIDYAVWGLRPLGFHITSLLLHFGNGLLLAALVLFLLESEVAATIAAALFLIHPVQSEAATWIASRGDLLMTIFLLGALLLRIQYALTKQRAWLAAALSCFALAVLSKETAIVLPLVLIAIDAIVPAAGDGRAIRQRWVEYLLWAGVAAAYLAGRAVVLPTLAQRPYWGGSLGATLLTMSWASFDYLRLLVLPLWLHVDYVVSPVKALGDWRWLAGVSAGLAVTLLAFVRYRNKRWPPLAAVWFALFLLPVSNLVPITAVMAERFLYVPMIGVCLLAGWLLAGVPQRVRGPLLALICVPLIALTAWRNLEWREPGRFWRTELSRSPYSVIAANNLGQYHYRAGDLPQAESLYRRGLAVDPSFPGIRASLGDIYYKTGRYQQALDQYREYLRLEPAAFNRPQAEQRMQRIMLLLDQQRVGSR